jgi:hypothetical protein
MQNDNPRKDYGQWRSVSHPFERVHLDFFHFRGKQFLILVDCFTRWIEVKSTEVDIKDYGQCTQRNNLANTAKWEIAKY